MQQGMIISLDGDRIAFSPDGKIDVEVALAALSGFKDAGKLLAEVAEENPEAIENCERRPLGGPGERLLADSETWESIFTCAFTKLEDFL